MKQVTSLDIRRHLDTWVFDDKEKNLRLEPFVAGTEKILNHIIGPEFDKAELTFSAKPFPGYDPVHTVRFLNEENGGAWYQYHKGAFIQDGWLCPVLFMYFETAPKIIFFKLDAEI